MWFKNVRAYRLTQPFNLSPEKLAQKLVARSFVPCGKSQAVSAGWVSPLGEESEELVHAAAGRLLIKLKREEKLLPSTVVREQLDATRGEAEQRELRIKIVELQQKVTMMLEAMRGKR